jgi:hypothetical protein
MQKEFYEHKLYPLQDKVQDLVTQCETPFYLTGGTALSRNYLHHRYSHDLDFFVNRDENFTLYFKSVIEKIKTYFETKISITDTDFARVFIIQDDTELKLEFINDVAFHLGDFNFFNGHKTDNPMNILSNKITALSRNAAKDFSDILFLSKVYQFNWIDIFNAAKEKDTWVNEVSAAETLNQFDVNNLNTVNWIEPFDLKLYNKSFKTIAKDILMGADNSLCDK